VNLTALAAEVRESLQVLATDKGQTVELLGADPITATADRALLRRALVNIVHNAIRHTPPQTLITIRAARRDNQAVVEVTDQGAGIASEHQVKIFDRFYRVDKARSRAEGGHGLGLAIAKWSVEHQRGRIEVESALGKGSVFRITLPT